MFPTVKSKTQGNGRFVLKNEITVSFKDESLYGVYDYLKYTLKSFYGLTTVKNDINADIEFKKCDISKEEYHLIIANNGIIIEYSDVSGAIYAVSTLLQLAEPTEGLSIPCTVICDAPSSEIRGVHFYMPERSKINEFKRIIDSMAFLKLNTVILEVGGGMQYERHPEINESWVKFCENVNKFPGFNGYRNLQGADFYWKDSVHTELAGGSFLTKNEVRDIVKYCKSRGMNVIPEVQGLSHAYYLTVAHPEIAELENDPFPDTYCPNNEKSYEIYFDVAEEVIEVFEPSTVSIGHDEIRVLGWCDKCKGKSGHELVGKEILRLYEFYKEKGIRIAMWGESAQTFISYKGAEVGTKDIESYDRYGRYYQLPATYKCLDMLPNDILMLDWQHSSGHDSEDCYNERGFEVIYGNFYGSLIGEWERRTSKECFRGAEVSSWCPATEEFFARDGIFFEMAFASELLWAEGYTNEKYIDVVNSLKAVMPYLRSINKGCSSIHINDKCTPIYLSSKDEANQEIKLDSCFGISGTLYGASIDTADLLINTEVMTDSLIFLHNSKKAVKYLPSHYFMNEATWALGSYAVVYEDRSVELANVYYGRQIGVKDFNYNRNRDTNTVSFEIDTELEDGEVSTLPCYFTREFDWADSLMYNTVPIVTEEGTLFAYEWKNPHPDKKIIKIKPYHISPRFNVHDSEQSIVLFAVLAK